MHLHSRPVTCHRSTTSPSLSEPCLVTRLACLISCPTLPVTRTQSNAAHGAPRQVPVSIRLSPLLRHSHSRVATQAARDHTSIWGPREPGTHPAAYDDSPGFAVFKHLNKEENMEAALHALHVAWYHLAAPPDKKSSARSGRKRKCSTDLHGSSCSGLVSVPDLHGDEEDTPSCSCSRSPSQQGCNPEVESMAVPDSCAQGEAAEAADGSGSAAAPGKGKRRLGVRQRSKGKAAALVLGNNPSDHDLEGSCQEPSQGLTDPHGAATAQPKQPTGKKKRGSPGTTKAAGANSKQHSPQEASEVQPVPYPALPPEVLAAAQGSAAQQSRAPSSITLLKKLAEKVAASGCMDLKEILESVEFVERVRKRVRRKCMLDLAAGHGLVGLLLAAVEPSVEHVIFVDWSMPPSHYLARQAVASVAPWVVPKLTYFEHDLHSFHDLAASAWDVRSGQLGGATRRSSQPEQQSANSEQESPRPVLALHTAAGAAGDVAGNDSQLLTPQSEDGQQVSAGSRPATADSVQTAVAPGWSTQTLQDALHSVVALGATGEVGVVAVHACGYLTDVSLNLARCLNAPVAAMPCCYTGTSKRVPLGVRRALGVAWATDVNRLFYLQQFPCYTSVDVSSIPDSVTPANRILLAQTNTGVPHRTKKTTGQQQVVPGADGVAAVQ